MTRTLVVAASAAAIATGCDGGDAAHAGWTRERAESITGVRGMNVRVVRCDGVGTAERDGASPRYVRFACRAGARRPGESYDTVAIDYEIHVRDSSGYTLENVRFHGGPGIP